MEEAPVRAQPVGIAERIDVLDVLRGFALLGIAIVNIAPGGAPIYAMATDIELWTSPADHLASWLISFLAEGKFYPLFSFLFGVGFAIQLTRSEAWGTRFGGLYARRLAVLLIIGLVHAFLIWYGDILVLYSVLGFVLLVFFRGRSPRALLVWAGVLLLIPIAIYALLLGFLELGRGVPEAAVEIDQSLAESEAQYRALGEQAVQVYSSGSWTQITAQRAQDVLYFYSIAPFFYAPNVLAMLLIGLYTWKRGVFQDLTGHMPFIGAVFRWGLAIGLLGSLGYALTTLVASRAIPTLPTVLGSIGYGIGGPALGLGYAAGLVLLVSRSPSWRERLAHLAAAGRMALTNYLLQSVIATTVFYSFGFGLTGRLGPALGIILALAIYSANLAFSTWWLRRFRFGPVEWLWRSLTYGHPQPMRSA